MSGLQYVGGGDWLDLPTEPVRYRGAPKHEGLDWGGIRDQYLANGGTEQPDVFADATTIVHRSGRPNTYVTGGTSTPKHRWEDAS